MNVQDSPDIIVPFTLRLPASLRRRIKIAAAKEDKSATEWMIEALEMVVKYNEEENA